MGIYSPTLVLPLVEGCCQGTLIPWHFQPATWVSKGESGCRTKALDNETQVLKAEQCQYALKRKEQSDVGRAPVISASLHEIQRRSHAMDQQIGHSAFLIIRVKEKGFVALQCKDLQTSHDFQSPVLGQVSMVL